MNRVSQRKKIALKPELLSAMPYSGRIPPMVMLIIA